MEKNHINLQNTIRRFPTYEPGEVIWDGIKGHLEEQPLRHALLGLPDHEPDERLWALIDAKNVKQQRWKWGYVAAVLLVAAGIGRFLVAFGTQRVAYTQEAVDERLQVESKLETDHQYRLLKAYCETETLVCSSREYRTLLQEYEALNSAAMQLSQAIGDYNTRPELVRQYSEIERQKTDILNAMAKLI